MLCWICKKETRFAFCGNHKAICYHCIGEDIFNEIANYKGPCMCCEKEIGNPLVPFRQKSQTARLVQNGDVLCGECFEIAKEARERALLNPGGIPENTEYVAEKSFPGPRSFHVMWRPKST